MEKRCPLYCLVDELTFTAHVGPLIIIIITLHNYYFTHILYCVNVAHLNMTFNLEI
jgi:hypothetical protein